MLLAIVKLNLLDLVDFPRFLLLLISFLLALINLQTLEDKEVNKTVFSIKLSREAILLKVYINYW